MAIDKKLQVTAIENGTVIDHIPADALFKIINILQLDKEHNRVTFGTNLASKLMGSKAIIKINDRYCEQEEINRIALIAPMAIVNTIKNFDVVEKRTVTVPKHIEGFVRCVNPKCITNNEPVETRFSVVAGGEQLALKCRYCEKITYQNEMELIK